VSIWHGDRDATVVPANADALIAQWTDVHGVDSAPMLDTVDGFPRKFWRRDGVDVVESFTIAGMAHGTPLDTATHGGEAGPFLLEAGISSSYHIARFFGLTGETHATQRPQKEAVRTSMVPDEVELIPDDRVEILEPADGKLKLHEAPSGSMDVMAIITKALTQAGLMKPPA
jgi:feruloyl esterase